VRGHLAPDWSAWFDRLTIRCHDDGTTTLVGPIQDQAALYGTLLKVRDLGLQLIAVVPLAGVDGNGLAPRGREEPGREGERGEDG